VIADEVYEKIVFEGHRHISIASLPGMRERTITINALSKAYAMTGWRVGYCVAPPLFAEHMKRLHVQLVTCADSISQRAALAALTGDQSFVETARQTYESKAAALVAGLNMIPGVSCVMPGGSFYAYPNVSGLGISSLEFARRAAREGVLVYPATAFGIGGEGYLRVSVSKASAEEIQTGVTVLQKMAERIRPRAVQRSQAS
jgi:aspartate/methionine/tyrosine aminotransferase